MHRRRIALSGVTVEIETEHDDLARYLAAQFPDGDAARGTPDIAVRVRWTDGPRPTLTPEAVFPGWPADVLVHRHVWTAPGRLLCLQCDDAPEIAIASAPGTPRRFELRFHFTLGAAGWREAAKRALRWRHVPALRRSRLRPSPTTRSTNRSGGTSRRVARRIRCTPRA